MIRLGLFAVALAMPQVSFAGESIDIDSIILEPSSPWQMNYGEDSCQISRSFGEANNPYLLILDQWAPDNDFQLTMSGRQFALFDSSHKASLQFGPGNPPLEQNFLAAKAPKFGNFLVFDRGALLPTPEPGSRDGSTSSVNGIDTESMVDAQAITVSQGDNRVVFQAGTLAPVFKALNSCSNDLVGHWGLNAEAHKSLSRAVTFRNPGAIGRRILSTYPIDALMNDEQGDVRIRLIVDERGKASDCIVVASSGSRTLDDHACKGAMGGTFEPALDQSGNSIRSFYITVITYGID